MLWVCKISVVQGIFVRIWKLCSDKMNEALISVESKWPLVEFRLQLHKAEYKLCRIWLIIFSAGIYALLLPTFLYARIMVCNCLGLLVNLSFVKKFFFSQCLCSFSNEESSGKGMLFAAINMCVVVLFTFLSTYMRPENKRSWLWTKAM